STASRGAATSRPVPRAVPCAYMRATTAPFSSSTYAPATSTTERNRDDGAPTVPGAPAGTGIVSFAGPTMPSHGVTAAIGRITQSGRLFYAKSAVAMTQGNTNNKCNTVR